MAAVSTGSVGHEPTDPELAGDAERVPTDAELAEGYDPDATPDPPVYDARGNVRPRGTEGARPMSYEERVAIATRLQNGEDIDPERPAKRARARTRKATS